MLEEGTTTRSAVQIAQEIEQLGAGYAAQTAARRDACCGSTRWRAIFPRRWDWSPTSRSIRRFRRRKSSASARRICRRSSKRAKTRAPLAEVAFSRALYGPDHPYGRSNLGTEASMQRIGEADLRDFWQRWFRPDNAALIVVGAIDAATLRSLAERLWAIVDGRAGCGRSRCRNAEPRPAPRAS